MQCGRDHELILCCSNMESSASHRDQQNQSDTSEGTAKLCKALREGNLPLVRSFSVAQLTDKINKFGDTALHIAVLNEHRDIVRELVNSLLPDPGCLELRNNSDETALNLAAVGGIVEIAHLLVERNPALLEMENKYGKIPLVVAAEFGHKWMVNFLYEKTPKDVLTRASCSQGLELLMWCIATEFYDIAVNLVKQDSTLARAAVADRGLLRVLYPLAKRPAAFPSGIKFSTWQNIIYSSIERTARSSSQTIARQLGHSAVIFLKDYVPSVKQVYELKLEHDRVGELLSCILQQLGSRLYEKETENSLYQLLLNAVLCGNVGFIAGVHKIDPDLIWFENTQDKRPLLHVAVLNSQVEVYRLLLGLSKTQFTLDTQVDEEKNSIVHQAALLSPYHQLSSIPGPALQMQRELQWFKEAQMIAPAFKEFVNEQGKTPGEVFTEQHQELAREGEKWMKETAISCTVIAALIVTVAFAAPFTVPGGYKENTGIPIYLHSNGYIIFVVSNALSLFFSSTSVLFFLGIHTSLYREEDFLKSLPAKLMFGLSTLFLSIAAMMIAFSAAIVLLLSRAHRLD